MRISDWSSDVCSSDLWVKGPEYAKQLLSWRERLGAPNSQGGRPQALPTDKPRKRGMSGNSASCMVMVPGDLTAALHARTCDMAVYRFEIGRASGRERGVQYG